ncbi:MAG: TonB-dependent receptor [Halioglobus sp.]|nr:TonB-dependent receptor [Halioglobus sp.]
MRQSIARAAALVPLLLAHDRVAAEVQEQVLVTASRVEEAALALPLSWSVVDSEELQLVAPVHIAEILPRVPGAWISRQDGQESLISLRSPVFTGAGSCGAFFTAGDSIGLRAPGFCNVNQLFDSNFEQAGRIEVIKGPATALYGSNAMHGVINVLSAAPTAQLDHVLSLEGGPDDYYRGKYHYRDTIGRHGLSVNFNGASDGGYKDDSGYDQQKATLRHDYAGDDWSVRTVLDAANLNQETAGSVQGYKAYQDSDLKDANPNPEAYRDAWSMRLYSSASLQLNDSSSIELTPYLRANDMEFRMHFVPWAPVEKNDHQSLGLRATLRTEVDGIAWSTGIDSEYTEASLSEVQDEPFSANQPQGVHYDYDVDAQLFAVYGQLRTQYDSPWEISAGVRWEYNNYDYDNRTQDGAPCGPQADNCRFFRPADRQDSFGDWSLNAGASYRFSDTYLGYLRVARGFRAPQASELYRLQSGQASADLDSEEIDNIELGFRADWDGGSRLDLAVYYMQKDEVIFQDPDRQNISGASTDHLGVELGLQYWFDSAWYLGLDANWADHTYDSRVQILGSSGDIKGNDIDTAPNLFGSARLGWDLSALSGQDTLAELEWVYMDNYYLEPDNLHEYDGHSLLNLRMSSTLGRRWSAALRVTNLLDEEYAERADFGFGSYRYWTGRPRGAYVEISYRFGVQ